MDIIDISRPLHPELAVWPGDRSFEWSWSARIGEESPVNVGAFAMSTHAGTHADAPLHYEENGTPVDDMPLKRFFGPVEVRAAEGQDRIRAADVADLMADRVLFKTGCSQLPETAWPERYPTVDVEAIRSLSEQGTVLMGTDAPSVDPEQSSELPAHHALARAGIVNLEHVYLRGVAPGLYHLVALPLKLASADAAPVRAALVNW